MFATLVKYLQSFKEVYDEIKNSGAVSIEKREFIEEFNSIFKDAVGMIIDDQNKFFKFVYELRKININERNSMTDFILSKTLTQRKNTIMLEIIKSNNWDPESESMRVNYSTKFKIQSQDGQQLQYKPSNLEIDEEDIHNILLKKRLTDN